MPLFRKQSAAMLPSLTPHDSKARLLSGRDSQGFMAKPCTPHPIAQRVQPFKLQTANAGGRGALPSSFLLGDLKGDILFREREYPPLPLPSAGGIFFLAKRQELLYAYMHNVKPYG